MSGPDLGCRLAGLDTIYIEPGSPWENLWIESFSGRVRDELLNVRSVPPPSNE